MSILVEDIGLLFLGVPGAASTAIQSALEKLRGARWIGPKHAHLEGLLSCGALGTRKTAGLEIACIVRNPFDLLHAEWFRSKRRWVLEMDDPASVGGWDAEKRQQIMMSAAFDFSDFIGHYFGTEYSEGKQISLFENYTRKATKIGRFEDLDEFRNWFRRRFGLAIEVPVLNHTNGRVEYWRDYSSTARKIVETILRDEIERFGYRF